MNRADVGRFASLLAKGECERPIYDQILLETHGCVLTPTLGSILPRWLLVIPRIPAINFAHWEAITGTNPYDLVHCILANCEIGNDRVIWFEHGASEVGSRVGCGVDQAHLHVIIDAPFSFVELVSTAAQTSQLTWQHRIASTAHQSVELGASYLFAASMDDAVVAQNVESAGSQFFRRVIAKRTRQADTWNYLTHPHIENVRETVRMFKRAIHDRAAIL